LRRGRARINATHARPRDFVESEYESYYDEFLSTLTSDAKRCA